MTTHTETKGWGTVDASGAEIWDAKPTFTGEICTWREWCKLFFYPKKFFLYRALRRAERRGRRDHNVSRPFRILDVGCGTGASVIDFKKMFGRQVEVVGIDVVKLQINLAETKMKQYGVWADVRWYDGRHIPFPDQYFDAVYSSDVLGHVEDVLSWLGEISRVLVPGGTLAMFSESKLGKHAWIRKYLFDHGLNIDPHAEFHISLFSKTSLKHLLQRSGFEIQTMLSGVWVNFFLYPDEYYEKLQSQNRFPILRAVNAILYRCKKKFHPYSTAAVEVYCLLEMWTIGRFVESQGYIIVGRKKLDLNH